MNPSLTILLIACLLATVHLTIARSYPIDCSLNGDCDDYSACIKGYCVAPCLLYGCGENATCTTINHIFSCRCPPNYTGDPFVRCTQNEPAQSEGKECSLNRDCDDNSACIKGRCAEPCLLDVCGENAACATINHNPICKCLPNYTGNAFVRCTQIEPEVECPPNACGNNTVCKVFDGSPTCSCLYEFSGNPLTGCSHECESSDECGSEGRCTNFKCYPDVAPGGIIRLDDRGINPEHPCDPNPCSEYNEFCRELKGHAFCQCQYAPFRRLPESGCNPECGDKFDCPSDETCISYKCVKSCPGDCSPNEECFVVNHKAKCRPKNSRPECTSNNDCSSDKACDGYKCVDPCLDYCVDENTDCQIVNQEPICNCKQGYHRDFDGAGCYLDGYIHYVE